MPSWSYIPYIASKSLPPSLLNKEPAAAFHTTMTVAAIRRISATTLLQTFQGLPVEKLHFLQRLLAGVLTNRNGQSAYLIVLESFGKPHLILRNLSHTLQDPKDRHVYIIHLEDALHQWRSRQESGICWEFMIMLGCIGLVSLGLTSLLQKHIPVGIPS